jgi:5-methylcytosine-specific restriction endonuclease McrA
MPTGNDPQLNTRRYRNLKAQVRAEEPDCWLCGQPIDLTLDAQVHPLGSTIDHVIPRSSPAFEPWMNTDRQSVRHAHRQCNNARQANSPTHTPSSSCTDW